MYIAILDFTVSPTGRPEALAALLAEAETVRSMPGNIAFRPYVDPVRPDAVCVVHEWADAASFAAYANSDTFRRSGAILRPMMTSSPVSRRMTAQLVETV